VFGTIARWRLKADVTDEQLNDVLAMMRDDRPASSVAIIVYRSASDPREIWVAGAFESREAYVANAATPEQNARFARIRALIDGEPEWHDGDVIYAAAEERILVAT
jgi:quinol monooxygenase YgiN